jgi:uncharacterized protein
LDCKYCAFLSKEMLHPGDRFQMSHALLETYIRQLLEAHPSPEVNVAWQGGEPTLMGLPFFRRSVEYVEKFRKPGQRVLYTMQTNGTLLNEEWCAFFREHRFLIGLGVDGPKEMHDAYRVAKGGAGSFDQVMCGWHLLRRHEVEFNVLCTIHAANANHPIEVYRFFRDELKTRFMQFIPLVERTAADFLPLSKLGGGDRPLLYTRRAGLVTRRSVGAEQFGRFLIAIFDEWVRRDVGNVFVQNFDVALGSWLGQQVECIFSPACGHAVALEHNGDLYSCRHFVEPGHRLGNIRETPMAELAGSEKQRAFGQYKLSGLPKYCRECDVLSACHGECPRNRFIAAPDGEPGLNYLCAGYKMFFQHIGPAMKTMAGLLRKGRAAAGIMRIYAEQDLRNAEGGAWVGPDSPCPCRSGKKFKHCHGVAEYGRDSRPSPPSKWGGKRPRRFAKWMELVSQGIQALRWRSWSA